MPRFNCAGSRRNGVRQGLDAVIVPAPSSPSRVELKLCGTSACEAAQLRPSIVNNAASYEMSQHLVGVFLEAFTFAKTTQSKKTLKLMKTLMQESIIVVVAIIIIIFLFIFCHYPKSLAASENQVWILCLVLSTGNFGFSFPVQRKSSEHKNLLLLTSSSLKISPC